MPVRLTTPGEFDVWLSARLEDALMRRRPAVTAASPKPRQGLVSKSLRPSREQADQSVPVINRVPRRNVR